MEHLGEPELTDVPEGSISAALRWERCCSDRFPFNKAIFVRLVREVRMVTPSATGATTLSRSSKRTSRSVAALKRDEPPTGLCSSLGHYWPTLGRHDAVIVAVKSARPVGCWWRSTSSQIANLDKLRSSPSADLLSSQIGWRSPLSVAKQCVEGLNEEKHEQSKRRRASGNSGTNFCSVRNRDGVRDTTLRCARERCRRCGVGRRGGIPNT